METKPHILVVLASTREGRQGEKVARWIFGLASQRTEFTSELVDLKEWPLPFYESAKLPIMAEKDYPTELERRWVEKVGGADGFIFVTPEYNHGYNARLKNAIDYVYAGWNAKPLAITSYGGTAGGVRAAIQLHEVGVEVQMVPIRAEVNIPFVNRAFNEQGDVIDDFQKKRAATMFTQLAWWAEALREARAKKPYPAR